jgi:SAM-dependent methyltransferase
VSDEPQNIYDDPHFFAGYSNMERFSAGWQRAFEWPLFQSLLPQVGGKRALDLGCGAGQLARYLAEQGAAEVIGLDVSARMLEVAQRDFAHPRVTFQRTPIEDAAFDDAQFEIVVSSLAFHYVEDYAGLARRIGRWLAPGGTLAFSTEHPLYTGRLPDLGWVLDASGARRGWAIDRYGDAGLRTETWFVEGVQKYHRPVSALVNPLIEAGLQIERLLEPVADAAWIQRHPQAADEARRPMFLLIRAGRPEA